ncbi:MAG: 2Fe-2S iron-sulfur cluster-binding protein [Bacteroidales bacterium]|nr:2Fe-2S iron-sulfur cluster-binding protein [Bacteroidales bacterium]
MKITINNRLIETGMAVTILDAAMQNDIYIPSLCAHPELTPYGGCRLCIIEIEGRKGFPTACTTIAEEGMIVRTETQTLQEMRRDLIQLILSEHPSACLICKDVEGCAGFQETIRKVGVTTGCRWCPKDKDCELQRIVDNLGISELTLPGLYRDFPVEKYDPFFDRDYNLCIYCGRCVRICTEHRKSSVLSLKQRGKLTTIGPAYDNSHIDAECEFCGACVSVCPTGAMSEKSRKWWGLPEKYEPSVCPLCSLNCDLQVLTLKNRIVGTVPPGKPHESGGELCVKGRFCLSELVNRTERILEPQFRYPEGYGFVTWDFAIEKTKDIIRDIEPGRSAVFISPGMTLEEIASAGIFAEKVLKTDMITSSCMDGDLPDYMEMAGESVTIEELKNAGLIVSFFLNGNYRYGPLTMAIKSLAAGGIPYYEVGWLRSTTTRFARKRLIPASGKEVDYIRKIISCLETGKNGTKEVNELVKALKSNNRKMIILTPEIMSLSNGREILQLIRQIVKMTGAKLFMPNQFGNLNGLLSLLDIKPLDDVLKKIADGGVDMVYFLGDTPQEEFPTVKHKIYQNAFPAPSGLNPDVIFPTCLWGESGGSYMSSTGQIKKFHAVAAPQGYSLPHQEVLAKIIQALEFSIPLQESEKITGVASKKHDYLISAGRNNNPVHNDLQAVSADYPFLLIRERDQHVYNNLSLSDKLEGFGELVQPGHVMLNPADAKAMDLKNDDIVELASAAKRITFRAVIRKNITKGFLFLQESDGKGEFETNPCPVNIKRKNV